MIKRHLVKRCCASCQHRQFDEEERRVCVLMSLIVENGFVCPAWDISEGLAGVGQRPGRVKRPEYLRMVMEVRLLEQEALDCGRMNPEEVATIEELRRAFEEKTGLSIYLIK